MLSFFDKLPVSGGTETLLSLEQLQKKLDFTFKVGLSDNEALAQYKLQTKDYQPPLVLIMQHDIPDLTRQTQNILKQRRNDIGIVHLDEELGYSLMALTEIDENQVIDIYSGEMLYSQDNIESQEFDESYDLNFPGLYWFIRAKKEGSFSRFCQHLPTDRAGLREKVIIQLKNDDEFAKIAARILKLPEEMCKESLLHDSSVRADITSLILRQLDEEAKIDDEFTNIQFNPVDSLSLQQQVATANLSLVPLLVNDIWYLALVTNRPIVKHGILGLSYSKIYWQATEKAPKLFQKNGLTLDAKYYQLKDVNLYKSSSLKKPLLNAFPLSINTKPVLVVNKQQQVFWDIPDSMQTNSFNPSDSWANHADFSMFIQAVRETPFVVKGFYGDAFYTASSKEQDKPFKGREVRYWQANTYSGEKRNEASLSNIIVAGANESISKKTGATQQIVYYYDLNLAHDEKKKRPIFSMHFSDFKKQSEVVLKLQSVQTQQLKAQ